MCARKQQTTTITAGGQQRRLIALATAITTLTLLLGAAMTYLSYQKERAEFRSQSLADMTRLRSRLLDHIQTSKTFAISMASFISTNPQFTAAEFRRFAQHLLQRGEYVRNVGVARGTVLQYVYPKQGNEAAIGLDYRQHPAQWRAVQEAIETGKTVLDGPIDLVQGGTGLVCRTPVYTPNGRGTVGYWGLASTVLDAGALLRASGIDQIPALEVALRTEDQPSGPGRVFFGRPALFDADPITLEISLPSSSWQMGAIPRQGWAAWSGHALLLPTLAAVLFSLMAGGFGYWGMRHWARDGQVAPPAAGAAPGADASRVRLLLVDDCPVSSGIVRKRLDRAGMAVEQVASGAAAIERFTARPFDLVLMDLRLPDMDGVSVTRRLRAWERTEERSPVPIIAFTAASFAEQGEAAMAAGCSDFLAKPAAAGQLQETIAHHVGKKVRAPEPDNAGATPGLGSGVREKLSELRTAAFEDDLARTAEAVHSLKGLCMLGGLRAASELCRRLEDTVAHANKEQTRAALAELEELLGPGRESVSGTRLVLIEDHALTRAGIKLLLEQSTIATVVGEAEDGLSGLKQVLRVKPDAVLVDLNLPGMGGAEVIWELHRRLPQLRILVLTATDRAEPLLAALNAGAHGIVLKSAGTEELHTAIGAVIEGRLYLGRGIPLEVGSRYRQQEPSPATASLQALSPRERQVLTLVAEGHKTRDIADKLNLSPKTVEKHRANLRRKLGASNAAELVMHARREGLI